MNAAVRRAVRTIDLAGALASVAAIVAFGWWGVRPILQGRSSAREALRELGDRRRQAHAADADARRLKQQLDQARVALAADPLRLEDPRQVNRQLVRLESIAAADGLDLREIHPGTIAQHARYQTIQIRLTGTGTYGGCVRFLHDLHGTMRDAGVVGFDLAGNPEDPSAPSTFVFDLCWYAAAPAATAAAQ